MFVDFANKTRFREDIRSARNGESAHEAFKGVRGKSVGASELDSWKIDFTDHSPENACAREVQSEKTRTANRTQFPLATLHDRLLPWVLNRETSPWDEKKYQKALAVQHESSEY